MIATGNKAKDIFLELVAGCAAKRWEERLAELCGEDRALRSRVRALLDAHREQDSFLLRPADPDAGTIDTAAVEPIGAQIGPYKLLEQIGEGGMGLVYMAEQQRPLRRLVALKLVKPGMDTKQVIARFEAERQALAMMEHPNIARVLDGGTTPDGRPYFVMELVRGVPINELCEQKGLSLEERLRLMIDVCRAVQHAHQKGIIHRDLKPTNVLVTMADGVPVPKVIDFGIAKALGPSLTEHTLHTAFAQLVGTPLYMSPEQAEMNQFGVDTRSDVYSLGVLLYELITGTTPFDKERLKSAGFDEMRRIIREEEPETVSMRMAPTRTNAAGAGGGARRGGRIEAGYELDWIVAKCLEKDRNRRYESASALGSDLQRYLNDEAVVACPPSAVYRFRKFAGRNKAGLTTAVMVALCLVAGTTVCAWQAIRATAAEARATVNERKAKIEGERALGEKRNALAAAASEKAAKEAETELRKQAERNFEAALDAVDRMLANSYDETLRDIPRARLLQRKLLQDAMAFFERLPREGISVDARFRIGRIWRDIAQLWNKMGDYEQVKRTCDMAIEDLNRVVETMPNHSPYMKTLGQVHNMAGWNCFLRKEVEDAEKHHRRELDIYVHMAREKPEEKEWLTHQATALGRLAVMFNAAGNREKAIDASRQSIRLLEQANANGDALGWQLGLLALYLTRTNPEEAESLYRRAITVYRAHIRQDKEFKSLRRFYAEMLQSAARFFEKRHPGEVEALLDEGISVMRDELARPTSGTKTFFDTRFRLIIDHQASFLRRSARKSGVDPQQARQRLAKAQSLRLELIDVQRQMVEFNATENSRFDLLKSLQAESAFLLSPAAVPVSDPPPSENPPSVLADAMLTEAIQVCRRLAAEFPGNADYRSRMVEIQKLHAQHFGSASADK